MERWQANSARSFTGGERASQVLSHPFISSSTLRRTHPDGPLTLHTQGCIHPYQNRHVLALPHAIYTRLVLPGCLLPTPRDLRTLPSVLNRGEGPARCRVN
jgi:hypothetical protein